MDETAFFTVEPEYAEYSLGEPVQLILTFDNRSETPRRIDFGANGLENIQITIIKDGSSNAMDGPRPGGISRLCSLQLGAHESQAIGIFLDEYFRPIVPGTYELIVRIKNEDFPAAQTKFEILQDTEYVRRRLESRYVELAAKLQSPETSSQELVNVRKAIVFSRNSAALELQEQLLREKERNNEEFLQLVDAIIVSKSPKGIKTLIEYVLENRESTYFEKTAVLNALRVAGAKDWAGELFKLIESHLQRIESSIPMVVSD